MIARLGWHVLQGASVIECSWDGLKAQYDKTLRSSLASHVPVCRITGISTDFRWTSNNRQWKNRGAEKALGAIDQALELGREIHRQRNRVFRDAVQVWYQTWYPRVAEANGRRFLHDLDDVKDHVPDRTIDMSFLIYRQLQLPFGEWHSQVQAARNSYAQKNRLPERREEFEWNKLD